MILGPVYQYIIRTTNDPPSTNEHKVNKNLETHALETYIY